MNLKLRFKNKVTLTALAAAVIGFIYQLLDIAGITAAVPQNVWENLVMAFIDILAIAGILTDPTTKGIGDSVKAMNYDEPAEKGEKSDSKCNTETGSEK